MRLPHGRELLAGESAVANGLWFPPLLTGVARREHGGQVGGDHSRGLPRVVDQAAAQRQGDQAASQLEVLDRSSVWASRRYQNSTSTAYPGRSEAMQESE